MKSSTYRRNRRLNRLHGYDYSTENLYFVTTCIRGRICCFGEITQQRMVCNDYGNIAEKQWKWLGEQYPYVQLHAFVVMPNHIHGIIEINRSQIATATPDNADVGTGRAFVGTGRDLSLQRGIKIKSLSELMGAYKTTVSKQIHLLGYNEFAWQRSFYDRIIRDENALETITNYIANNPAKWQEDRFFGGKQ